MNKKILILDGYSLINRGFYAIMGKKILSNSQGLPTNAVLGFLNIINKYFEEEKPDYICIAFDVKKPTFRHLEYAEYKATRKKMPDELAVQIPYIRRILDAMRIASVEREGYEADDLIGSMAKKSEALGLDTVVVSGDRDLLQIATGNILVKIPVTKGGKTETELYDEKAIEAKFAIKPHQLIDVKALMGDSSDNIPGVRGVGEKTALSLIQKYSSLEGIYENIDKITGVIKTKIEEDKDIAYLSRKLATIVIDLDVNIDLIAFERKGFDEAALYPLLSELELNSIIQRFGLKNVQVNVIPKKEVDINIKPITSINDFCEIQKESQASGFVAICLNTGSVDNLSLGIYPGLENSYYIDFKQIKANSFYEHYFKEIIKNTKTIKYIYDYKSYLSLLKDLGYALENKIFDVFIAGYVVDSNSQKYRLDSMAKDYLDIDVESIKNNPFEDDVLGILVAKYAYICASLGDVFDKKIKENEQEVLFREIEMPLPRILFEMEEQGVKLDKEALEKYSDVLKVKIESLEKEIYSLAGEIFNLNSPKQLGVILFEKLGLPVVKNNKSGYSTDIEVLEELLDKHEVIKSIIDYRHHMKIYNTYVEPLSKISKEGDAKVHTKFNQTGTVTGRLSSVEPNLQNIPYKLELGRQLRKVFVAEGPGHVLIDADYSQIELRILAHVSQDENLIKAFNDGLDIHAITAAKIFNVPITEVTSFQRSGAKAINFGIIYGLGDFSLSKDLGVSRKEARAYIDNYLGQYPKVSEYMKKTVEDARGKGYALTMFGRRRDIPEIKANNYVIRSFGERAALNAPIQGAAADIMKLAMVKIHNEMTQKGLKSKLLLQVHDEILIDAVKAEVKKVKEIVIRNMSTCCKLDVELTVEIKEGVNWYETK